ncbi:hypothetical protein IGJ55_001455 [Enterococcus sp. AZ170]|uniref:YfhO family protein n=1 Tax=unclassified Enterococcus TaxID=2608891 RepID=UPI003D2B01A2
MNFIFRKNGIIIIFLILISITSIFPYFFNNYIFSQDDLLFHRTRLESYTLAVKHLDFFPRIFPTMGLNFGYGADLFYPSILLLPFALFRIGGFSFVSSYYLFQLFISFITAIISYYFFYSIHHSKKSSLLFSCFYTLSTYRLIDQSVRAALGETLAFAFLPLLVLGIYTLFYTHQHHWKLLAIGMSLLIASHLITAFYSFLLLLIFLIFNWKKCKLAQLKSLTKAFLLTVGLSAWFLFPYLEQIEQLKFNFNNTTLWANGLHFSLGDLFINSLTNLSAPFTELKPNIGLFLLVTIIAALFSYPKLTKTTQRLTLLTLFVILLATNLFPWAFFKTSILATIQFPWRLLLFASFFASLLAVYLIEQFQLDSKKEFLIFIALSIFLTIGFNSNNLVQARIQNNVTVTNENFSDFYESEIGHGKEYLVKDTDFKKYFASPALIIDGVPSTTNFSDPSSNKYNYNHFTLRTNGTQEVQLPKFFYKGYEVIDNQKVIPNYNKAGLVTVKLNEGEHALSISYKKTLVQKISVIFSILIFGILCFQYIGKKILNK